MRLKRRVAPSYENTWRHPVLCSRWFGKASFPDLQQLLGTYYQQAQQAEQQRLQQQPRVRGPVLIQTPGLVYEAFGRQRSFHGRCYIPQMVPAGMQTAEIQ